MWKFDVPTACAAVHPWLCPHPSSNDDDFIRPRGFEVCFSPLLIASKNLHGMDRMMLNQEIRKRTATHWGDAVELNSRMLCNSAPVLYTRG